MFVIPGLYRGDRPAASGTMARGRASSSLVERHAYNVVVRGSIPRTPTRFTCSFCHYLPLALDASGCDFIRTLHPAAATAGDRRRHGERLVPREAEAMDPRFRLWVRLTATFGLRRGETTALPWEDFDFEHKRVLRRPDRGIVALCADTIRRLAWVRVAQLPPLCVTRRVSTLGRSASSGRFAAESSSRSMWRRQCH